MSMSRAVRLVNFNVDRDCFSMILYSHIFTEMIQLRYNKIIVVGTESTDYGDKVGIAALA